MHDGEKGWRRDSDTLRWNFFAPSGILLRVTLTTCTRSGKLTISPEDIVIWILLTSPAPPKWRPKIQGYGSHARDLELWRFKDLCMRHCHLVLDGWAVLPIAYPSIKEAPRPCQQLILSFIGKFISLSVPEDLSWLESEALRFARRCLRSFTPSELSAHLKVSPKYARTILHNLTDKKLILVTSGGVRARTYRLNE